MNVIVERTCQGALVLFAGAGIIAGGVLASAVYLGWPNLRPVPETPKQIAERQQQLHREKVKTECADLKYSADRAEKLAGSARLAMAQASTTTRIEIEGTVRKLENDAVNEIAEWARRCAR
jgi:hypothetical protein